MTRSSQSSIECKNKKNFFFFFFLFGNTVGVGRSSRTTRSKKKKKEEGMSFKTRREEKKKKNKKGRKGNMTVKTKSGTVSLRECYDRGLLATRMVQSIGFFFFFVCFLFLFSFFFFFATPSSREERSVVLHKRESHSGVQRVIDPTVNEKGHRAETED